MTKRKWWVAAVLAVLTLGWLGTAATAQMIDPDYCLTPLLEARGYAKTAAGYASRPGYVLPNPTAQAQAAWMQAMTEYWICKERQR